MKGDCSEIVARFRELLKTDAPAALDFLRAKGCTDFDYAAAARAAAAFCKTEAAAFPKLERKKLAIISSSTTVFIEPLIKLFGALDGFAFDVVSGDFGNWRAEAVSANSRIAEFRPDIVLVATHWRDAALPDIVENPSSTAEAVAREFAGYCAALRKNFGCAVILQNFDSPLRDSCGLLSQNLPNSAAQTLRLCSLELLKAARAAGAELVDLAELRAKVGAEKWEDARMWFHAKQHPAPDALPALATEISRVARAKFRAPKKVCVVDLDNTLWGGFAGEDGVGGIRLGAPDADGEAYAAFQKYLLGLKARGVLLCACSKNNEHDALAPFEKHPSMVLKRADIISFKVNWELKSKNIAQMAKDLNLGLDSFVFIDDTPSEILEVSRALPEVECVQLPADPSDFISALDSRRLFDALSVSGEDKGRHENYRRNIAVLERAAEAADVDDFLKSLNMKCEVLEVGRDTIERVGQMIAKTNQYNLTTRRHSEEKVLEMLRADGAYGRCFRLEDSFGDNGISGLVIALPDGDTLEIDTFIMSCRVIGRGLESFMLNDLAAFAKSRGFKNLRGVFLPTARNVHTKALYPRFGMTAVSDAPEKSVFAVAVSAFEPSRNFISKV